MTPEDWHLVVDTHLTAMFLCCGQAIGRMRKRGKGGAIVNIASAAAIVGIPGRGPYSAAKAGISGLDARLCDRDRRGQHPRQRGGAGFDPHQADRGRAAQWLDPLRLADRAHPDGPAGGAARDRRSGGLSLQRRRELHHGADARWSMAAGRCRAWCTSPTGCSRPSPDGCHSAARQSRPRLPAAPGARNAGQGRADCRHRCGDVAGAERWTYAQLDHAVAQCRRWAAQTRTEARRSRAPPAAEQFGLCAAVLRRHRSGARAGPDLGTTDGGGGRLPRSPMQMRRQSPVARAHSTPARWPNSNRRSRCQATPTPRPKIRPT